MLGLVNLCWLYRMRCVGVLVQVIKWGSDIDDCESMLRFAGPWIEMATYSAEVLKILDTGRSMSSEDSDSPIFQDWVENNNITRRGSGLWCRQLRREADNGGRQQRQGGVKRAGRRRQAAGTSICQYNAKGSYQDA